MRLPLKALIFPLGLRVRIPEDQQGGKLALSIVEEGPVRDRLVDGVYRDEDPNDAIGRVMRAYHMALETQRARDKINDAIRKTDPDELQDIEMLMGHQREELVNWAVERDILPKEDGNKVLEAMNALYDVIRVDAFAKEDIEALAKCSTGKLREVERP